MITNKKEAKTMTNHISCDCKCKFNSTTCKSNQKRLQLESQPCICENDKYLKSFPDTSVIRCDGIVSLMNIVPAKMINTIATNVSINHHSKKVK